MELSVLGSPNWSGSIKQDMEKQCIAALAAFKFSKLLPDGPFEGTLLYCDLRQKGFLNHDVTMVESSAFPNCQPSVRDDVSVGPTRDAYFKSGPILGNIWMTICGICEIS